MKIELEANKDKRDCPKCGTRMEYKYDVTPIKQVFQCPKCKNIELVTVMVFI
jgi:predicted nucleic-acid-binding Zn-ribbon protein